MALARTVAALRAAGLPTTVLIQVLRNTFIVFHGTIRTMRDCWLYFPHALEVNLQCTWNTAITINSIPLKLHVCPEDHEWEYANNVLIEAGSTMAVDNCAMMNMFGSIQ